MFECRARHACVDGWGGIRVIFLEWRLGGNWDDVGIKIELRLEISVEVNVELDLGSRGERWLDLRLQMVGLD